MLSLPVFLWVWPAASGLLLLQILCYDAIISKINPIKTKVKFSYRKMTSPGFCESTTSISQLTWVQNLCWAIPTHRKPDREKINFLPSLCILSFPLSLWFCGSVLLCEPEFSIPTPSVFLVLSTSPAVWFLLSNGSCKIFNLHSSFLPSTVSLTPHFSFCSDASWF